MSRSKQAAELDVDIARAACVYVAERLVESNSNQPLTVEQLNATTHAILRLKLSIEPEYVSPAIKEMFNG